MVAPDELQKLKTTLVEARGIVRQADLSLTATAELDGNYGRRKDSLEERLVSIEQEYEELLERNLSEADIEEVKGKLSGLYATKSENQVRMIQDMREYLARQDEENYHLRISVEESRRSSRNQTQNGTTTPMVANRTVQQQIADFDVMKKSLMRGGA